ncbi:MAG: tetratricopeptide repeat protein [Chloroflexi bacterium]|nr:tetratricopeptide repeat protein [Chloroflexota bacterium]
MADISLRDYFAKMDGLLEDGAADEVIHHCRHILQYFPKNADTYRYLGRALVYTGTWDRAVEVFRRVLSVYPDDYIAHAGLSEAYLNLKRPDEAIWHLERAYEQDPNNQEIIESLREMYRKFRRVDQTRLQLTAGAVARQYIRNGLYEQAIDTLRQVLERNPERVDLRLLLARTYNDAGRQVEAGEAAVEVLKTLPDCLEANRILTDMWLSVQRPSDAQRYLNRIQSVDPYLALELAQGQPVPDDQFRLEELDYRRSAQEEIISRTPDWLQAIEPGAALTDISDSDWMQSVAAPAAAAEPDEEPLPDFNDELFSTELPDDWLTTEPESATPRETARPHTGLTGLLSVLNEPEAEVEAAPAEISFDDLFPDAEADTVPEADVLPADAEEDVPERFADAQPPEPAVSRATAAPGEDDPLAWLHGSGIELVDEPEPVVLDDDDDLVVQAADEVNPLAWLEGYGDHLIADEAKAPPAQDVVEEDSSAADVLDWMQTDSAAPVEAAPASTSGDTLDWLADESLLEEALSLEELTGTEAADAGSNEIVWAQDTTLESERQDSMAEENPLAWLDSQDDNQKRQEDQQPEQPDLNTDDWFADLGQSEADASQSAEQPEAPEPGDEFEWITGETAEPEPAGGMLDWLSPQSEQEPEAEAEADLDWLSGSDAQTEEPAVTAGTMPDWMAELEPPEISAGESQPPAEPVGEEFDWLAQAETGEEAEAVEPASEMPEWLMQAQPEAEPAADAETMGGELDWLAQAETGEEAEAVEPASEMPEWLMEAQPEAEPAADAETMGGELDWLAQAETGGEEEAEEAAEPDWLAEMQSRPPEAEAAGSEPEWMSELGGEPEVPAEEAAEPDWLAEMQSRPPKAAEPQAADEPAWLSDLGAGEPEGEPEAADQFQWPSDEPAAATDVPDWLTQLESQQPEAEAPETAGELAWMSDAEMDEEETVPGTEDAVPAETMPDWLAQMQPQTGETAAEETLSWMQEFEEGEAQPADLPAAEQGYENELAWEEEAEAAGAATVGDMPDWLSAVQEQSEPEPVASAAESSEFSWIDDINAPAEEEATLPEAIDQSSEADLLEPELEPAPASNAPDWLNAMVPGLDVDYAAPEDAPIEQTFAEAEVSHRTTRTSEMPVVPPSPPKDFDWLIDIVEEESRQMPAVEAEGERRRFVFSRQPAWLRQPVEQRDDPPAGGSATGDDDSDLPPWLR